MAKFWTSLAENLESGGSTWFGKLLAGVGGSLLRSLGVFLGESMSGRDQEYLDYQDKLNDENAEVAYQHQREFMENYLTPQAQIISQAKGYEAIGMNKMAMAGTQLGATSSSVPQASAPTGGAPFNPVDLLGTILNYKLGQRKLDLEEEFLPHRIFETDSRGDLSVAKSLEIRTLLPKTVEKLDASIDLFREEIKTEQSQQLLNQAGITEKQANALVSFRQAAILAIDEQYRSKFLESEINLNDFRAKREQAAAAHDWASVREFDQRIQNLQVEHDNLLKEGIRKTIENGQMAHELTIISSEAGNIGTKIKQENAGRIVDMVCDGVNTVTGIVTAGAGVAGAAASVSRARTYKGSMQYTEDRSYYNSEGSLTRHSKISRHR